MVTQMSEDRLDRLHLIMKYWEGAISSENYCSQLFAYDKQVEILRIGNKYMLIVNSSIRVRSYISVCVYNEKENEDIS